MRLLPAFAFASVFVAGCATETEYAFRQREPSTPISSRAGEAAGRASLIPPEGLKVRAVGPTEVTVSPDQHDVDTLAVQLVLFNSTTGEPWKFDPKSQRVKIAGQKWVAPLFSSVDVQNLPNVEVASGERRVVTLFFPLPKKMNETKEIPSVVLSWRVATEHGVASGEIPFERITIRRFTGPPERGYPIASSPYLPYQSAPLENWMYGRDYSMWDFPTQ